MVRFLDLSKSAFVSFAYISSINLKSNILNVKGAPILEHFLRYFLKKDSNSFKKPKENNSIKLKIDAISGRKKFLKRPPKHKDIPRNKEQTKFIIILE